MRAALTKMLTEEKAAGDAHRIREDVRLMNMSTASREYQPAAYPSAYLEREDYLLIWRMLDAGAPVQVELNVQGGVQREADGGVQHHCGNSRDGETG